MSIDWKGIRENLRDKKTDRSAQFRNYLTMIDRLSNKRVSLKNSMVATAPQPARAGTGRRVATTDMKAVMDKYHQKALRLAQYKYYAKQVG
jgi:hypothetical protein